MATIFRPPTIFANWRRDPNGVATSAQAGVTQDRNVNLLVGKDSIYQGPGQVPSYDWPNPTRPKSSFASLVALASVWQNGLVNLLVGKDTFFRGPGQAPNYDWPNPTLAKSRLVSAFSQDQVWQNGLANVLVGQDRFFGGPGQAPVYDWPNPLRINPGRLLAAQGFIAPSLLVTLLAVTAAAPFTPVDLPNPRGAVNRVALSLAPLNLLTTTLAGQDAIYGGPGQVPSYDWPNPRGARALYPADPPNLLGTTLAPTAAPFTQGDWPNPRGAVNRAALDFVPPYLFGTTLQALPVGATLWPQPIGRPRLTVYDPPNLLGTLLAAQAPFYQTDWPNPKGAVRGVTFDPQSLLNTAFRPGVPFYQTNWPNPIVPGPRIALKVEYAASQNFYPPTPPPPPSATTPEGRIIHFGQLMIRHS